MTLTDANTEGIIVVAVHVADEEAANKALRAVLTVLGLVADDDDRAEVFGKYLHALGTEERDAIMTLMAEAGAGRLFSHGG
jgi:hypothetical protein